MTLTIVADIVAVPGKQDDLLAALKQLIPPTLKEAGCLQYDLHHDLNDPTHFVFYENWQNRELWLDHMNAAHIKAHGPAVEGMVESVAIHEMKREEAS